MKTKGFIEIPALRSNVPGEVNIYGELSNYSLTFSREQGIYPSAALKTYPAGELFYRSFISTDINDGAAVVSATVKAAIDAVAVTVYDLLAQDQMGTAGLTDPTELATFVAADSDVTTAGVTALAFTDQVDHPVDTPSWMPGSAFFQVSDGGNIVDITIWFVNSNFETQYDEYEINVAPPASTLDDLYTTPNNINSLIVANTTGTATLTAIDTLENGDPSTHQELFDVTWYDPNGSTSQYETPWIVVGYGPMANNPSYIKDAIRDYIIAAINGATTAYTQPQWEEVYPSLFELMEFYLIPYWDQVAVAELAPNSAIYSPILVDVTTKDDRGTTFSPGLTPAQVAAGSALVPAIYKSILMISVGNPNNTGGVVLLNSLYGDYAVISTTDNDFDRLDPDTKDFIVKLNEALNIAESATASSPVSAGYTRVTRNSRLYISFSVGGVDFFVLLKQDLLAGI